MIFPPIKKQPPEVLYENDVLRSFTKFTGKHLCQSLFFNKLAGQNTFSYRTPLVAASANYFQKISDSFFHGGKFAEILLSALKFTKCHKIINFLPT